MKALEILEDIRYRDDFIGYTDASIDKAISELKALQEELGTANEAYLVLLKQYHALQEPKTCDGCKWLGSIDIRCIKCERSYIADYYEPKENQ